MTTLSPCAQRSDIDMYASSVSSAELSPPPPRPDSPRLLLADSSAVVRARLCQLQVWGDAAEEEREEFEREDASTPFEATQLQKTPRDRMADRTRPSSYNLASDFGPGLSRRKSLFCGRPLSDKRELTRKPSLWVISDRSRGIKMSLSQASCGADARRSSFRRRASFHRYARISGDARLGERKDNSSFAGPGFDDLTEGLDATKVTEIPAEEQ